MEARVNELASQKPYGLICTVQTTGENKHQIREPKPIVKHVWSRQHIGKEIARQNKIKQNQVKSSGDNRMQRNNFKKKKKEEKRR